MEKNLAKVKQEIEKAERIGLMTHVRGDGDAFGSMLGLRNILEMLGKEVIIFSNEEIIRGLDKVGFDLRYNPQDKYEDIDALVLLDLTNKSRVTIPEVLNGALDNKVPILVLDHHQTGDISEIATATVFEPESSSASEVVYKLAGEFGMKINKEIATYLLVGVETDTQFLRTKNTNTQSMGIKSELLKSGARIKPVLEEIYQATPINNLKFLGTVLERIHYNEEIGLVSSYVLFSDYQKHGIKPGSSSGVANYIDQTKEGKIVAVAEELEGGKVKVSMRSNGSDIDVEKIAKSYGGGGHIKAAGFEVDGKIEDFMGEKLDIKIKNKLN